MEPTEQLARVVSQLVATVDNIQPAQLAQPTPCAEFTVHDVLDHMMVLGGALTYGFRGEAAPDLMPPPVYGRVPADEFREVMTDLLTAAQAPGAAERMVVTPFGEMPGAALTRMVAFDGIVHTWDLATSTGQEVSFADDLVEAIDGFVRGALVPGMRDGDTFKNATEPPADATAIERLVAFSGRTL